LRETPEMSVQRDIELRETPTVSDMAENSRQLEEFSRKERDFIELQTISETRTNNNFDESNVITTSKLIEEKFHRHHLSCASPSNNYMLQRES
jgi:hypothetical protein